MSNFGFIRDDDVVDQPILDKFHVLRKVGNTAVHASGDVKKATARLLLNELFHVGVWAAQRYTVHPDDVPVHAQFSPSRISSDLTGATGSADHTVLRRTAERQQAEITELRAAIADARVQRTGSDTHDYYEAATRRVLVDELLHEAGWDPDPADADHELTGSGGRGAGGGRHRRGGGGGASADAADRRLAGRGRVGRPGRLSGR